MRHRRKTIWGLGVAIVATLGLSTSFAVAQGGGSPDGGPAGGAAGDTAVTTGCGARVSNFVKTENAAVTVGNTGFVTFASTSVLVSSGATRCIKVEFTAEAACTGTSGTDFCYVRALDNGIEMNPSGASFQVLVSEDPSANGHAFEWVRRVGSGPHAITLQRRVGAAGTSFFMDDWTFDVEVNG